jgi:hypothetical protein
MGAILAAACSAAGCTSALRGGAADLDVHLHTTYLVAREAGFGAREARLIAAANYWVDLHPATSSVGTERRLLGGLVHPLAAPSILAFGLSDMVLRGESPARAFGSQTARATAWALSPMAHRLHFPAPDERSKVSPAYRRDALTGDLVRVNRDAVAVLEMSLRTLEARDPDLRRSLALLGIGLHTLQDSYKHAGYDAAGGHIGVHPDPDDVSHRPDLALEIAEATYHSLLRARRLLPGARPRPVEDWTGRLQKLYAEKHISGDTYEDRWVEAAWEAFGDEYDPWDGLSEWWRAAGGGEAFERALEAVRGMER